MFLGVNETVKKLVREHNQCSNNPSLIFSFVDLELVEINNKRRKFRIISKELSKKIHEIYSWKKSVHVPQIKFIDYETELKNDRVIFNFPSLCYKWWMEIKKTNLRENAGVSSNGTLIFNSGIKIKQTPTIKIFFREQLETDFSNEEDDLEKQKEQENTQSRFSALQAIENTIQNGNIDLTTLAESMLFLGESYISARPDDCLFCNKELGANPESIADYYQTHLKKCIWRPDRINEFKDKQVALIERIITQFNNYKEETIQEIIREAQDQNITETELNNTRPNWQNTLRSLTNREKITEYFTKQLEIDIQNLATAKTKSGSERQKAENEAKENAQKEEERLKKEREDKHKQEEEERKRKAKNEAEEKDKAAKERAKQQELKQQREKTITEINSALNQEPKLINSELSPEYQNWEEKINRITDIQQITNFQDRLLADIQARRHDKKTAQEVKENLNKARTGTKEEKEQAWKDLEKLETEKSFQENQTEVESLKKEKAAENPSEYSQEAKQRIEKKLKNNQIKENELNSENQQEWKKLKSGQIKDPAKLVEIETKITQNIYQKGVQKIITSLTSRVNQILKSKPNQSQIAALKKELLAFISSSNIYYTSQKKAVENLLNQLENHSTNEQNPPQPQNSPWKIIIPFLLIGLLITLTIPLVKKRIKTKKRVK
ncbi:MAG: hypothetical protein I3273_03240 [Candidatus Moeniiplasma glomeromycotorum]|nr:hypothetical protein [Candidatus Moeniiplasma glomeromycotorum]MCE8167716.1 hypothetical protein [Candidatus Moeniiplasma glomeromycotorum]MCE8169116.1 hypothetical protein [Candidatus Moeniiplasma glomeromycotorum]